MTKLKLTEEESEIIISHRDTVMFENLKICVKSIMRDVFEAGWINGQPDKEYVKKWENPFLMDGLKEGRDTFVDINYKNVLKSLAKYLK